MLKIFGKNPNQNDIKHSANYNNGSFNNSEPTQMLADDASYLKMTRDMLKGNNNRIPSNVIPHVKTDLNKINQDGIVWFGHSSYHLIFEGKRVLVDPVFSGYASPFSFMIKSFAGSNVYQSEDFNEIDLLILTHDHYDHLDYYTLLKLKPKIRQIVCSLGVASHLKYWGFNAAIIDELDWWQSKELGDGITITATPARHFSGRGLKRAQTLWSSFVLESPRQRLFLGGDSGYGAHFNAIGSTFGGFDLAILECGQYNEKWPMIHMAPEETVQAGIDLNAHTIMPVHWGKFALAYHDWNEPIIRFTKEATHKKVNYMSPKIGDFSSFKNYSGSSEWWQGLN